MGRDGQWDRQWNKRANKSFQHAAFPARARGGPLKRQLRRHMGNCVTIVCYMISIIKWATAVDVAVVVAVARATRMHTKINSNGSRQQQEMSMIIGYLLNCRSLDKCLVHCVAPGVQPHTRTRTHTHKYTYTHVAHATKLASGSSFHVSLIKINQALLICLTLPLSLPLLFSLFASLCSSFSPLSLSLFASSRSHFHISASTLFIIKNNI